MRGGSVQLDRAAAGRPVDHVGFEALAVAHVSHLNFLVGVETCPLREIGGDGQAAFTVEARTGHGGAVQF